MSRQNILHNRKVINALVDSGVLFEGPYTTSSGILIPIGGFIERIFGEPKNNKIIIKETSKLIKQIKSDCILGCEMVGVPFAANIAYECDIPFSAIRKNSTSHGVITNFAGNIPDKSKTIVLFDDWNGGWDSIKKFYQILQSYSIKPKYIISLVESFEDSKTRQSVELFLIENDLIFFSLCTFKDIIQEYLSRGYLSKDAYLLIEKLLNDPNSYSENHENINKFIDLKHKNNAFLKQTKKSILEEQYEVK